MLANTPKPPYYAVIFTSVLRADHPEYSHMSKEMIKEVQKQDGFLGFDSARDEIGITVSYWKDKASIAAWKKHSGHQVARGRGKLEWYSKFKVRICVVEKEYGWSDER